MVCSMFEVGKVMDAQILSWVSWATGFIAALTLFWAGLGSMQSWKGTSESDLRLKRRKKVLKWVGIPSLLVSFGCQAALRVMGA